MMQMRTQAAQLTQTQRVQVMAATGGVMRSSSSKIPHLVVGPDGIELSIAHKERIKAAMQPDKKSTGSTSMVGVTLVYDFQGCCHRDLLQMYQTQYAEF